LPIPGESRLRWRVGCAMEQRCACSLDMSRFLRLVDET
jgi:hypothetical protein